ncbi:MAG: hypothetical protein M5U08_08005 [Burkholderiales bacterium]|nr:hypothetical protein [Burkholderiales bacterium]
MLFIAVWQANAREEREALDVAFAIGHTVAKAFALAAVADARAKAGNAAAATPGIWCGCGDTSSLRDRRPGWQFRPFM